MICTLAFCILAGALGAARAYLGQKAAAADEEAITLAQKELAENKAKAEELEAYAQKSIYCGIDSYNKGFGELVLYIQGEKEEDTEAVALAYSAVYKNHEGITAALKDILGDETEEEYIYELIGVKAIGGGIVSITAAHGDKTVAEQMAAAVLAVLQEDIAKSVAPHTVKVVAQKCGYEKDGELQAHRQNVQKLLNDAQTALKASDDKLAALTNASGENPLKYCVAGGFAGFVIGCLGALCGHIFGGKLTNAAQAEKWFKLPVLGVLPQSTKRRWFDKRIRALEGEPNITYEQAAKVANAAVALLAAGRKTALVASNGCDGAEKLMPYMAETLCFGGNITTDAAAVERVANAQCVVILAQRDKTDGQQLKTEVERLGALGKNILGIIVC